MKQAATSGVKFVAVTLLWTAVFAIVSAIVFPLLFGLVIGVRITGGYDQQTTDSVARWAGGQVFAVPVVFAMLGLALCVLGKLPGTGRKQSRKRD